MKKPEYKLTKSECIEKRKKISEILTEEGFVMILDRVSAKLFNTLPRYDELGNVPLIYYKKYDDGNMTLFCIYWGYSSGSLHQERCLCKSGLKNITNQDITDIINNVKGLFF